MRRLAIVLLALLLVLAACSGGDEEIARAGGTSVKFSEVRALYDQEPAIDDGFRDTLFAVIALKALTQALSAQYGAGADPTAVENYYTQFTGSMTSAGYTPAQFLGVENASLELVRFNAEVVALRDAAILQLTADPEVVAELFADPATLTEVCAKHILVATREEADTVMSRLAAGEDFATVASEVSLDTSSEGGDLGCTNAGDYVGEFAAAAVAAPLNEVTGPVESEFGFHVILVSSRSTPTQAEYFADPFSVLSQSQMAALWGDWISEVLAGADVWVAEKYGTWSAEGIVPPASETTTTTSAPGSTTTTAPASTTDGG